ncbi:MAG: tetratricopeptide repeat protein [Planctomycetota bacterium]
MVDWGKLIAKAEDAIARGNFEYAINIYSEALKQDPQNDTLRKSLYLACTKNLEAKGKKKLKSFGFMDNIKMTTLKTMKKYDKIIEFLQDYLIYDPHNTAQRIELASTLAKLNMIDAAISEYEIALLTDASNIQAAKELGYLYTQKGDAAKAQRYFSMVLKYQPDNRDIQKALRDLSALGTMTKSEEEATTVGVKEGQQAGGDEEIKELPPEVEIKKLLTTIQQNPDDPTNAKHWSRIGDIYQKKLKNLQKALEAFTKASEIDRLDPVAKQKIGNIKIAMYDEQINKLKNQLQQNPSDQNLKAKLDALTKEKNDFMLTEYARRVKEKPTDYQLRFEYGRLLFNANRYDDAIAEFQVAGKDPKKQAHTLYYSGICFLKKGLTDVAITNFQKALKVNYDTELFKEIEYALAKVYETKKMLKEALEEYKKIMEADYKYKDVSKKVETLTKQLEGEN